MYRVYLDAIILILESIRDYRNQADPKVTIFIQFPENLGFNVGLIEGRNGEGWGGARAVAMCVYVLLMSQLTHHMAYFLVHSRASSLYFSLSVL